MDDDLNTVADGRGDNVGTGGVGSGRRMAADQQRRRLHAPDVTDRRSIMLWAGAVACLVAVAVIIGGILLKLPYVALVPGSARDTEPLLAIDGIEDYPSDGELMYLTVRVRQRPNLWEYLWLEIDPDVEVLPEEVILGDRTPEENREFNLELMNDSKRVAVAVALEELGYDAVQTDAVVLQQLVPGEAADGILEPGDSILAIEGESITNTQDLVDVLSRYEPGDEIELLVERFGQDGTMNFDVELGDHPDQADGAFLGIQPADRLKFNEDFDFEVEIDSGSVGGPSAGLAFTLAVLDQLTEGELTGGETVAITGAINAAGQVGPVGGVVQKTATVRDLGIDHFIVPTSLGEAELAQVRDRAGDELTIIPVSTIDEALSALEQLGGNVEAVTEYAVANQSRS